MMKEEKKNKQLLEAMVRKLLPGMHLSEQYQKLFEERQEKVFSFTPEQIKELDKAVREITSVAAKMVGSAVPAFSVKSIVQRGEMSAAGEEDSRLQAVAESEVEDMDKWRERFKGKRGTGDKVGKTQFTPGEEEEYLKLRKQYYGPEGEIANVAKSKKQKPEKGIGELSPEEMEKAGYVIKVPVEVLNDFDVMVQELKETGAVYEQAKNWYHNIKDILEKVAGDDRGAALYGVLIATFSPRAKFSINLAEATFMFKAVQADAKVDPEKLSQYVGAFKGGGESGGGEEKNTIGHMKVADFALNLVKPDLAGKKDPETGELVYNEVYRWNSTIDIWMVTAFYPMLKKASTAGEWAAATGKLMSDPYSYVYLAELVARKAQQFGLLPHELQAIIWVAMKKRQSGEDAATTDDSFKQIEEAVRNIQSIHRDINEINEELKQGSWAASIAKAIDEKGFEGASEIVLGRTEVDPATGKPVKVRGVRSIAMSGEKGDKFKYFPDDPVEPGPKADRRIKTPKGEEPKVKEKAPYQDERFSDLKTFYVLNNVVMMPTGKLGNLGSAIRMYLQKDFSTDKAVSAIVGGFNRQSKTPAGFMENLLENEKMKAESLFKRVKKLLLS